MKHKLIVLTIAAALPLSALAQTGSPTSPGGSPSKSPMNAGASGGVKGAASIGPLDTNKDGYISREEAKASASISTRFSELDKDGDGKLSAQELNGASSASSGGQRSGGEPKTQY
jgi:hypothetical protein